MGTYMKNVTLDEEHIFSSRYPAVSVPENVTLPEFVLQGAELYGDKVAFVEAVTGKEITYNEVVRDTKRFAKALRSLGMKKGHVVIVALPNIAEYAIIALGIMAAGGVFSGANPASHTSEIKKQVQAAHAKLIVTDGPNYEKVKGLELPVIVIGTTGMSKGVMLSHRNLVANLCSTLFGVTPELVGQVTILGLIPFFHIYGITGICCATLRNKGKVVVMGRYELRTLLNALITQEITFAPIVPPIILNLVKNPVVDEFDLSKLKLQAVMTAAAPLAPELRTAFENKFPGVLVQEAYGLTEHSCITLTHAGPAEGFGIAKRSSVGFILPNLEVKFIDPETGRSLPKNTPGELCVRSQCVMRGYYNNEEETSLTIDKNGWLHTGDIGFIDDDENVFIVDRIKELIKFKGFQVAPAELEAILLTHPSIEDAAVVPLPDEEAGEIPAASIVMSKGLKENEEDIMNYVASNVAHYKKVRVVHFVESIPKSPSWKNNEKAY
ncbi:4-coumarate:CoA ligase-like protein [Quillaja saponaria]|uniref:4-coumarate:CoA ligase-like protein n=1 Tax=Quillaja saponaria TaxID=32244 RepID=A0AAD7KTQ9_QUISA|nr:4-coumarate:CoA ligase-like protein [Quillaja saponaria]